MIVSGRMVRIKMSIVSTCFVVQRCPHVHAGDGRVGLVRHGEGVELEALFPGRRVSPAGVGSAFWGRCRLFPVNPAFLLYLD